jgi:O-antigen/teichoic acid export membrane protein
MAAGLLLLPMPILGLHYTEAMLAILAGLIGSPWLVAVEVLTLEGRAGDFSTITIGSSLFGSAATLIALFGLGLGGTSLFIGQLAGAAVTLLGSYAVLRGRVGQPRTARWLREMTNSFWSRATANLFEHGQMAVERWLLVGFVDLRAVGIFNHAQQYRTYAMQAVNAVSRGTWPSYLEEAREEPPQFRTADETWRIVHVGVFLLGLSFALIGGEVIELVTNGKFGEAQPYATLLLLVLLIQASGKSQMTLLIARNRGHHYANLTTASVVIHICLMAVFVPYVGMDGLVTSVFVQVVFLRCGVYWAAGRVARVPFRDGWVIVGVILIPLCLSANLLLGPPLELRLVLLLVMAVAVLIFAWVRIASTWAHMRRVTHPVPVKGKVG